MLTAVSVLKKAARKAVMVVPTLAPIINEKALWRLTLRVATRGTIREVVTELDWILAVRATPQPKDLNGLIKIKFSNLCFTGPMSN